MDKDFERVYNRIIFKYTSVETALIILNDKKLLFSNPSSFNDPFDCYEGLISFNFNKSEQREIVKDYVEPAYSYLLRIERRKMVSKLINNPEKLKRFLSQKLLDIKSNVGVCCFSESFDNILLWSHYAEKQSGICLGFLISPVIKDFYALYPVNYSERIEAISCFADLKTALKHWLLTKAIDWKYEKEIRALSLEHNGLMKFSPLNLKQLYFGCKVDKAKKNEVLSLIKKDFAHVEIFQMSIDDDNFRLKTTCL